MTTIGQMERATRNRVAQLFREQLGYDYLGIREDLPTTATLKRPHLRSKKETPLG